MKNKAFRTLSVSAIIIAAVNFIASLLYIFKLPDEVPLHFNAEGICDGYGSKWFVLIFPLIILIVYPIGLFVTSKSKNLEKNMKPMTICMLFIEAYLIVMNWAILLLMNSGKQLGDKMGMNISFLIPVTISIMFIVMGNYMPTIRQNKNLGIKLPWTLKNERCWDVTHRYAGKVWVIVGIITLTVMTVLMFIKTDVSLICVSATFIPFSFAIIMPTVYAYKHRND